MYGDSIADIRRRYQEEAEANCRPQAKEKGYYYGYFMRSPVEFELWIYRLDTFEKVRTVPFVATMQEDPFTQAHMTMRALLPHLPDLTAAPLNSEDLTQLSLGL